MLKTIILYFVVLVGVIGGTIFDFDTALKIMSPLPEKKERVVLQVSTKGEFEDVNVIIYSGAYAVLHKEKGTFIRKSIDINPGAKKVFVFHAKTGALLKAVDLTFNDKKTCNVYVDTDYSYDMKKMTTAAVLKKGWSSLGFFSKVLLVLSTFFFYFFIILVPLGLVSMVFSIIMELTHGIYRPFTGSWFSLLIGLGWLFVFYHFGLVDKMISSPSLYTRFSFYALLAGYPLYFLADRGFDGAERGAARAADNARSWRDASNYTYTKTTWSDGRVTDDKMSSAAASYIGTAMSFLILPVFLPIGTCWYMVANWLIPVFEGDFMWYDGSSAPKAEAAPAPVPVPTKPDLSIPEDNPMNDTPASEPVQRNISDLGSLLSASKKGKS